jgi:hypothetical protein
MGRRRRARGGHRLGQQPRRRWSGQRAARQPGPAGPAHRHRLRRRLRRRGRRAGPQPLPRPQCHAGGPPDRLHRPQRRPRSVGPGGRRGRRRGSRPDLGTGAGRRSGRPAVEETLATAGAPTRGPGAAAAARRRKENQL